MRIAIALLACCGPLPSDAEEPKPVVDADAVALVHAWKITGHEMGTKTALSEDDATAMHGRTVDIAATGYTSPFHGNCEESTRTKRSSSLVELTADVDVSPDGRARLKQFGLAKDVSEYKLVCRNAKVPPLTIYLTGDRAMTCFGGVCYLLVR